MTPGVTSQKAIKAKRTLTNFANKINPQLEDYFDNEIKKRFGVNPAEKKLALQALRHIKEHNLRPAKRARAAFIYYGYKLFEKSNGNKIKTDGAAVRHAAMSIELVHTGLLMHDDKMDQDETRRGLPTTHIHFRNIHKKNYKHRGADLYGDNMAVDLGDAVMMLGVEILGKSKFDMDRKLAAINRLLRGVVNTAYGQAYDITLEAIGNASESDIVALHHAKTAIYTYENPLHIGAILAGAKKSDLELLSEYAIPGGVAFQLQDDILGLFGDPRKTGKPAHSDLRQRKPTLLITKALENSTPKQKKRLLQIWGKENLNTKEANEARKIVVDTGSLDYSKQLSKKWAKKAQKAMPKMKSRGWDQKAIDYLDGIAQYMVEREL
jgi:geranylgeranyl diphosphate synthase type I